MSPQTKQPHAMWHVTRSVRGRYHIVRAASVFPSKCRPTPGRTSPQEELIYRVDAAALAALNDLALTPAWMTQHCALWPVPDGFGRTLHCAAARTARAS